MGRIGLYVYVYPGGGGDGDGDTCADWRVGFAGGDRHHWKLKQEAEKNKVAGATAPTPSPTA